MFVTPEVDTTLVNHAHSLRDRAEGLRAVAADLVPAVGAAYRRRASELELSAWVFEVQSGLRRDDSASLAA